MNKKKLIAAVKYVGYVGGLVALVLLMNYVYDRGYSTGRFDGSFDAAVDCGAHCVCK